MLDKKRKVFVSISQSKMSVLLTNLVKNIGKGKCFLQKMTPQDFISISICLTNHFISSINPLYTVVFSSVQLLNSSEIRNFDHLAKNEKYSPIKNLLLFICISFC